MKAVILAGGAGIRLRPLTDKIPKALITLNGKPLMFYSLDNLWDAGIRDVLIVTGYLSDVFKKRVGKFYRQDMVISYVHNPRFNETGSMYSLSQTEGFTGDDIILLESDLLYEREAVMGLLNHPERNVLLTAPISGSGDEVYVRMNEVQHLVELGKGIRGKGKGVSELVGITKLSLAYLEDVWERARNDYGEGKMKCHYEEVIARVAKGLKVLNCLYMDRLHWIEIDKEADLERAVTEVLPFVLRRS